MLEPSRRLPHAEHVDWRLATQFVPLFMLGLVEYESDGEREGVSESLHEQQQTVVQPSTAVTSQTATSSATLVSLPDAASLFSSPVDSRLLPLELHSLS